MSHALFARNQKVLDLYKVQITSDASNHVFSFSGDKSVKTA